jgi:N-acetylglucosamine malate deacetylase 1
MSSNSKTVLSFGAHPDDIEFGCGGTERLLIEQGWEVTHAYLTSGGAGSDKICHDSLSILREEEARVAAEILGVRGVEFFRCLDGLDCIPREVSIRLISLIRRIKPQIIFVHATSDQFSDHKIVSHAVYHAIKVAGGPWFMEAGEQKPWKVPRVYGYEVWDPLPRFTFAVDISSSLAIKEKALIAHKSQVEVIDYARACRGLANYRGVMSGRGFAAEVFEVIKDETDLLA